MKYLNLFNTMSLKNFLCAFLVAFFASAAFGNLPKSRFGENYAESKVPQFELPDVLASPDGKIKASSAFEWLQSVRPRVLDYIQSQMYGYMPLRPKQMRFELREESGDAFGGIAVRRQIRIHVKDAGGEHFIDLLLYIPKNAKKPVPVFHGLNFCGNHSVVDDPAVFLPAGWVRNSSYPTLTVKDNKPREEHRGKMGFRWPVEKLLKSGYAFSTAHYGDIYPDKESEDSSADSIYKIFDKSSGFSQGPATIAWAWGNSRIIDCLQSQPEIDSSRIAVTGQSRLGRTAILTGALDERVALTLGNNPGCMGTAISRRRFGERIDLICKRFPFWFSPNLNKYFGKENELAVDQHNLVACIAPRLVYVASASEDYWGDPKGELMGLVEAEKVYRLFGAKNMPSMENLEVEKPFLGDAMGFHLRKGPHNMMPYDWENYIKFAQEHGW